MHHPRDWGQKPRTITSWERRPVRAARQRGRVIHRILGGECDKYAIYPPSGPLTVFQRVYQYGRIVVPSLTPNARSSIGCPKYVRCRSAMEAPIHQQPNHYRSDISSSTLIVDGEPQLTSCESPASGVLIHNSSVNSSILLRGDKCIVRCFDYVCTAISV